MNNTKEVTYENLLLKITYEIYTSHGCYQHYMLGIYKYKLYVGHAY